MLHRVTRIQGLPVGATDGEIGAIEDLYFDDERWGLRYLVVDTGSWLTGGRRVLISPRAIRRGEWTGEAVRVALTRRQVEDSPPVDAAQPVSRRDEIAHAAYYGYPFYWSGPYLWGLGADPAAYASARHPPYGAVERAARSAATLEPSDAPPDAPGEERSRLRSCAEVIGYRIEARDGGIGHLDDFLIDDETWGIPYLVVDKRAWLPGGHVLVLPDEVEDIDAMTRTVRVALTRDEVKDSPPYD